MAQGIIINTMRKFYPDSYVSGGVIDEGDNGIHVQATAQLASGSAIVGSVAFRVDDADPATFEAAVYDTVDDAYQGQLMADAADVTPVEPDVVN